MERRTIFKSISNSTQHYLRSGYFYMRCIHVDCPQVFISIVYVKGVCSMSFSTHIPSHRGFMIKLFAECIFAPILIPYHPWSYTCHYCLDWVVCAKLWFQRVIICLPTSTCNFVRIEFWLFYKARKLFYVMVSIDKLTMILTDNHAVSFRHSGHVYGNYNVRGHGNNIREIKKRWWSQWGELWWYWWWWW